MANSINFYVQTKSTTFPVRIVLPNGELEPPSQYISRFNKTTIIANGKKLPKSINLSKKEITFAALNSGYGFYSQSNLKKLLIKLNSEARGEIFAFYLSRIKNTISMLDIKNSATSVKRSHKYLESSDKTNISFTLASAMTFIAANEWIKAHNDNLALLIHERYFNKALSPELADRHPDYIAITANGKFHVFESKGGDSKNSAVVDGMSQLASAEKFFSKNKVNMIYSHHGMVNTVRVQPQSYVCVHTFIAPGADIEINAYDPPGQYKNHNIEKSYTLDLDYLLFLKLRDAIDTYNLLLSMNPSEHSEGGWKIIQCASIENTNIAIHNNILKQTKIIEEISSTVNAIKNIPAEQRNSSNHNIAIIRQLANKYAQETKFQSKIEQDIIRKFLNEYPIVAWLWNRAHDANSEQYSISEILRSEIEEVLEIAFSQAQSPAFKNPTENDYILDVRGLTPAGESNEKEPVWQQLRSKFRHISNNGI